ncbi:MAG TPA: TetR/AcrR family transcriptional regulator [Caulobacteraceae bacterium]|nr:TetR/AcrR family transcriptional regulator [Caulobacteraceae bacterium]
MPAPRKHRDAIVRAAVKLFRRQGYNGAGLADIVAESGAPKGSLYHYFPAGKAQIGEAAVRLAGAGAAETLETLARESPTAGGAVRGYAERLAGWLAQSDFFDGSPIMTTLLEMAPADAGITAAGREAFDRWRAILAGRMSADGIAMARAEALADFAIAAIEGALIQARVRQSAEPLMAAGRELERLVDAQPRG